MSRLNHRILLFLAMVGALGLFFGGPELLHSRSFKHAWDLGHVFAFAIWTVLLWRHWPGLRGLGFGKQAVVVLLLCVVVGGGLELSQGALGRYPSINDLIRDGIGCLFASLFFFPSRLSLGRSVRHLLQIACISLLLVVCMPLARSLIDEWTAWRQFPLLGDFEAPFELDRWSGDAGLAIDHTHVWSGRAALRIDLDTDLYSGAALDYFPGNWREWGQVSFSVYNPDAQLIRLTCKIADQRHDVGGYRFEDRFNRSCDIGPGWNHIRIDLADVGSAPRGREMDLSRITTFQLFAIRLPRPRTVYLDRLTLAPR